MTETLVGVSPPSSKDPADPPSAEELAANELVRQAGCDALPRERAARLSGGRVRIARARLALCSSSSPTDAWTLHSPLKHSGTPCA